MEKPLVNRVAKSGLITINLEDHFPNDEVIEFDLKDYLFKELILKEKDFREALKKQEWESYKDKTLLVFCSTDAIIPVWAYILVVSYATPFANMVFQGNKEEYLKFAFYKQLEKIDPSQYQDERIVIKGCSNKPVPAAAYMELARLIRPYAKSIMYGEPCSTVPIYKKKIKR